MLAASGSGDVADRIFAALAERKIPKMQFYKEVGLSSQAISAWKKEAAYPSRATLVKVSEYLGVSVEYLTTGETKNSASLPGLTPDDMRLLADIKELDDTGRRVVRAVMRELGQKEPVPEPEKTKVIPLFGTAAAAGPGEMDTGMPWEDYEVPEDSQADFAVRISGDSMEPVLHDGQIALCRKGYPEVGDVTVVMINGELICKQFRLGDSGTIYLLSVNRRRYDTDRILRPGGQDTVRNFGTVLLPKKIPLVRP